MAENYATMCPKCGGDSRVLKTLQDNRNYAVVRYRQCKECGNRWETEERTKK